MSFSWKVFFCTLIVTAVSFAIGGYMLITTLFASSLEQQIQSLLAENQTLRYAFETAASAVPQGDGGLSDEIIQQITSGISRNTAQGGESITVSGEGMLEGGESSKMAYRIGQEEGRWLVLISGSVNAGDGALYLESTHDITHLYEQKADSFNIYRRLTLIILVISSVLMYILSHVLTHPIRRLSRTTRKLAAGQLDQRITRLSDDEIGRLGADFNHMAESLEQKVTALETASRQREEFIAGFAHELKTPLTSIIGYADMLRSRNMGPETRFTAANYIFKEGRRLENLSLKLLELIVLGRQDFELKPVPVSLLFDSMREIFVPMMEGHKFILTCECAEAVLIVEPDLMKTLLINLIDNARKASPNDAEIHLSGESLEDGYLIYVRDRGVGIPPEDLDKIREAFYMVDKSRARRQNGAGLGLALCEQIAAIHDGRLDFESEPGRGTTVTLRLGGGSVA